MECGLPGSSVHGILQARILEWRPSPPAGDLPHPGSLRSPALASRVFTVRATWEAPLMSPESCTFHAQKSALNSLTWGACFPFINSNLFMLQLPDFHCKNSYISWLFPHFFQSSLSVLRDCLLSLRFVHEIEHNSQFLGCALFLFLFFLVDNYKKKDKFLANLSCGPRILSMTLAKMKVLASRNCICTL